MKKRRKLTVEKGEKESVNEKREIKRNKKGKNKNEARILTLRTISIYTFRIQC